MGFWESEYEAQKYDRTIAPVRDRRSSDEIGSILDLGCGNGAATATVADAFPDADVTGVDVSERALATARERAPDPTYRRADVLEFVAETDRTFDVVLDIECLCYLAADHSVTRLLQFADDLRDLAEDGLFVSTHVHMPRKTSRRSNRRGRPGPFAPSSRRRSRRSAATATSSASERRSIPTSRRNSPTRSGDATPFVEYPDESSRL